MTRSKTSFRCQQCGYQFPRQLGRCPECKSWNSMQEERAPEVGKGRPRVAAAATGPLPLADIEAGNEARSLTGVGEFDRILGGGVVTGSVILIGGDPGIGKTTLLLQILPHLAKASERVLYVSGEESPRQIKMRCERLGIDSDRLLIFPETNLEEILKTTQAVAPAALVVDSIQTTFTGLLTSAPGSISQVQEVAAQLMFYAKRSGTPVFLIGHVTKDGAIAGPRTLEHIVDTVLYFEGEKSHAYRILRAVKNRFGSTNEIGVFEMTDAGLKEVANPSAWFLSERPQKATGSVVVASLEGTRPILIELQALVSPTSFAMPRRMANGVDGNRIALLVAVMEKRMGLNLSGQDIYVNVVGGLRIDEPALDLGIVAAVTSSLRNRPIAPTTIVFGEVGLGGEVRAVGQAETRLREAAKLGFRRCLLPERNLVKMPPIDSLELIGVAEVGQALDAVLT
ncbi:MAG: DNA repair protein RadA [Nitrospirae bacterium]|nr:MAG: DNA repair protein RadA [Nitrospirota bacterium]